ncbi:hypothetical protein EGW08_002959 [Elysia chlorotica]|uniref:Uncharacterized protein n=1 Tax=Elysia chlorotica TaxID=188477 RepID=A0A433U638_ELYCH|nr:hypothetical protein EGW08_002959 [Elysia chlorotica]
MDACGEGSFAAVQVAEKRRSVRRRAVNSDMVLTFKHFAVAMRSPSHPQFSVPRISNSGDFTGGTAGQRKVRALRLVLASRIVETSLDLRSEDNSASRQAQLPTTLERCLLKPGPRRAGPAGIRADTKFFTTSDEANEVCISSLHLLIFPAMPFTPLTFSAIVRPISVQILCCVLRSSGAWTVSTRFGSEDNSASRQAQLPTTLERCLLKPGPRRAGPAGFRADTKFLQPLTSSMKGGNSEAPNLQVQIGPHVAVYPPRPLSYTLYINSCLGVSHLRKILLSHQWSKIKAFYFIHYSKLVTPPNYQRKLRPLPPSVQACLPSQKNLLSSSFSTCISASLLSWESLP